MRFTPMISEILRDRRRPSQSMTMDALGAAALQPMLHVRPTGRRDLAVDVTCTGRDGNILGWVRVRPVNEQAVFVENLNVVPQHRGAGLGALLLAQALAVGARWGRSTVHLQAEDRGSGRLLRWYEDLGFQRVGTSARGLPAFVASIHRALPRMQEKMSKGRR